MVSGRRVISLSFEVAYQRNEVNNWCSFSVFSRIKMTITIKIILNRYVHDWNNPFISAAITCKIWDVVGANEGGAVTSTPLPMSIFCCYDYYSHHLWMTAKGEIVAALSARSNNNSIRLRNGNWPLGTQANQNCWNHPRSRQVTPWISQKVKIKFCKGFTYPLPKKTNALYPAVMVWNHILFVEWCIWECVGGGGA